MALRAEAVCGPPPRALIFNLAGPALGELSRFRQVFYTSLTARADALFELTDAVLCADGPVTVQVLG